MVLFLLVSLFFYSIPVCVCCQRACCGRVCLMPRHWWVSVSSCHYNPSNAIFLRPVCVFNSSFFYFVCIFFLSLFCSVRDQRIILLNNEFAAKWHDSLIMVDPAKHTTIEVWMGLCMRQTAGDSCVVYFLFIRMTAIRRITWRTMRHDIFHTIHLIQTPFNVARCNQQNYANKIVNRTK